MGSLTWAPKDIPDLQGKVFIVTGGNSGIGYEAALELARHNAHVIIATHAQDPGAPVPADGIDGPGAVSKIKEEVPEAQVDYMELNLASFRSVRRFDDAFKARGLTLHCLINNAGLQTPPDATSEDGIEITLACNFYGHVYLTQLLQDELQRAAATQAQPQGGPEAKAAAALPSPRIVWVSSPAEELGETDWEDLRGLKRGTNMKTYGTSKLWMILMAMEFNDRLKGTGVESFACHPGLARTGLFDKADHAKPASVITDVAQFLTGQSAASGALSMLYAATSPDLEGKGGTFYGPLYAGPAPVNLFNTSARTPGNAETKDPALRRRLYEEATRIVHEVTPRLEAPPSADAGPGGSTAAAAASNAPSPPAEPASATTTSTTTTSSSTAAPPADAAAVSRVEEEEPRYEPKPPDAGRTVEAEGGPGLENVEHLKEALEEVGVVLTGPTGVSRVNPEDLKDLGKAAAEAAAQQHARHGGVVAAAAAPAGVTAE